MKVLIVLPCFNEAKMIGPSLEKLSIYLDSLDDYCWTIVCVDDGSTDSTRKLVKDFIAAHKYKNCEIKLLALKENVGKGGAIKAALMDANADVYGFMDADLSIDFIDALPKTLVALQSSDVVIGRREIASEYSWFRAWTTKCINSVVRFFLGTTVHDHQCGYKFFNEKGKDAAIQVERTRFSFDVEFLARVKAQQLSISEISVNWIHRNDSRVGMQDGFRFFLDLIAIVDLVEYKRFLRLLVTCSIGIVAALFFWVPFYGAFFSDDYTWLWKGSLILHHVMPWYSTELPHFISPIINLFYAINIFLFGTHAWVYFLLGLIVHVVNSILVGLLTREYTKSNGSGLVAASIFAIAGSAYEPLVWVGANMHSFATLFILLACVTCAYSFQKKGWQRNLLLAASLFSSLCAYGTKETSVTLIIFLCMTLFVSAAGIKKLFQNTYVVFTALSCVLWACYLYLNFKMHGDLVQSAGQSSSLSHVTALLRAPIIFAHMIVDITPFLNQITATILSAGVLIGVYFLLRFHGKISGVIIGMLWICIGLLPTIFLPSIYWWDGLASRYTYLPRVGLAIAVGTLLSALIRDERVARLTKPFVMVLIAVVFVQFTQMIFTVTTTYSRVYATGVALEASANLIRAEHITTVIMEPDRPFEENQAHIFGVMNVVGGINMSNIIFVDSKNNVEESHISNGTAALRWVPAAHSYLLILPDKKIKVQTRFSKW